MRRHRHNLKPGQHQRIQADLDSHPALDAICRFKQRLCCLLLKKHRTKKQCARLIPRLLRAIDPLRTAGLPQLAA
jgi:hypothetical protein